MRLLTFICRMLRKPSQASSACSASIISFFPSLNSLKFLILIFSFGTHSSRSSLRLFRHSFSFLASSFDNAGRRSISSSRSSSLFSKLFASPNRVPCSVARVINKVLDSMRSLLNFSSLFISSICGLTPNLFSTSCTFSVVGTKFSPFDFSGSSLIPCIRKLLLIL